MLLGARDGKPRLCWGIVSLYIEKIMRVLIIIIVLLLPMPNAFAGDEFPALIKFLKKNDIYNLMYPEDAEAHYKLTILPPPQMNSGALLSNNPNCMTVKRAFGTRKQDVQNAKDKNFQQHLYIDFCLTFVEDNADSMLIVDKFVQQLVKRFGEPSSWDEYPKNGCMHDQPVWFWEGKDGISYRISPECGTHANRWALILSVLIVDKNATINKRKKMDADANLFGKQLQ